MDPDEQTTRTRDEHHNYIVSVLYHALQGADACDRYAPDAEAEVKNDPADFFREARTRQAELAGRAKELLGIPSSTGSVPSLENPGDALPGSVPETTR